MEVVYERCCRSQDDLRVHPARHGVRGPSSRGSSGRGPVSPAEEYSHRAGHTKVWKAALKLENGTRKYYLGKTQTEAEARREEARMHQALGMRLDVPRQTLAAWLDHWLAEVVQPEREPTTYAMYEIMVRRHIKPYLGATPLAKLTPESVERWQRDLREAGASVETRRSSLVRLRTALNLAVKRGHLVRNVAALVELPKQARSRRQPPKITQLRRLLHVIQHDRMQALVYVALGASLRRAEVLGLHWEDVDLEGRTLTVRRRVNRVGQGVGLIVREGAKSESGERTVALPELVVRALRAHRTYQLEDYMVARDRWKGPDYSGGRLTGFIFTSEVGTVLEPRRVDRYFADVLDRMLRDDYRRLGSPHGETPSGYVAWKATNPPELVVLEQTFHGLRHDFAGLLLAAGVPGRVVMEMMGHADYRITAEVYQHVPDELQRLAADRLDALLTPTG